MPASRGPAVGLELAARANDAAAFADSIVMPSAPPRLGVFASFNLQASL